jgi:hypothetical protein
MFKVKSDLATNSLDILIIHFINTFVLDKATVKEVIIKFRIKIAV